MTTLILQSTRTAEYIIHQAADLAYLMLVAVFPLQQKVFLDTRNQKLSRHETQFKSLLILSFSLIQSLEFIQPTHTASCSTSWPTFIYFFFLSFLHCNAENWHSIVCFRKGEREVFTIGCAQRRMKLFITTCVLESAIELKLGFEWTLCKRKANRLLP